MNRKSVAEFTHNGKNFLTLQNSEYKQWVFRYTFLELEKDLGPKGDITTAALFEAHQKVRAKIVAREAGVLAGTQEIRYFLLEGDVNFRPKVKGNFEVEFHFEDGDSFKKDDVLLEITGDVHDLLAVERVALNLLMRMSGVATFTKKICETVKAYDVLITPTRKTLWGLLDKRAVVLGGGGTHRLNMSESILIKDTQSDLYGRDIEKILEVTLEKVPEMEPRFVEIEVMNEDEAIRAAKIFNKNNSQTVGVLLMDNVEPNEIKKAVEEIKKAELYDSVLIEASGGITEKNVLEYAKTGVDIISMGSITNGPRSLNMSLKIVK